MLGRLDIAFFLFFFFRESEIKNRKDSKMMESGAGFLYIRRIVSL